MFTIELSSPFKSGWIGGLGGPNSGGHKPPQWYIQYGMDLGVATGSDIYAAFDGKITKFNPHVRSNDTSKVYGGQLFVRHHNDRMGGFYTHFTDSGPSIRVGQSVSRGERLGKTLRNHLHFALVEIVGGAPRGHYMGVDLYKYFLGLADRQSMSLSVTFNEDGTPPDVVHRLTEIVITA